MVCGHLEQRYTTHPRDAGRIWVTVWQLLLRQALKAPALLQGRGGGVFGLEVHPQVVPACLSASRTFTGETTGLATFTGDLVIRIKSSQRLGRAGRMLAALQHPPPRLHPWARTALMRLGQNSSHAAARRPHVSRQTAIKPQCNHSHMTLCMCVFRHSSSRASTGHGLVLHNRAVQ